MLDIAVTLPSLREILVLFGDGTGKFIGKFNHSTGTTTPLTLISGFFLTGGFRARKVFKASAWSTSAKRKTSFTFSTTSASSLGVNPFTKFFSSSVQYHPIICILTWDKP